MIIVNLKGGLGNQMFQYALGYSLAKMKGTDLFLDLRYLNERRTGKGYIVRDYDLDIFGIEPKAPTKAQLARLGMNFGDFRARHLAAKILDRLNISVLAERSTNYDPRVFERRDAALYLDGYWQTEKYFASYSADIRKIFNLDGAELPDHVIRLTEKIRTEKSVCVNVRRGDFVGHANHGVVGMEYYERALARIQSRIGGGFKIYIFSDDIKWCVDNMKVWREREVVGHEYAGDRFGTYLYLMTQFANFVIPNSTFAWWAAWLSRAESKAVIAPQKWSGLASFDTADIIPSGWFRV